MDKVGALRKLPYMGVIWVVAEAEKRGFYNGHPDWCNLGQGQPEVGEIPNAPARYSQLTIKPEDHAYGPIHGTPDFRQAVADYYNRTFRKEKKSQYTKDNVAIAAGGRLALSRAIYSLGIGRVGYQLPDYTAYEDMLENQMHRVKTFPVLTKEENGFALTPEMLQSEIKKNQLDAFLVSNPCNPTGCVIKGNELQSWIKIAREFKTTLLLDEFYSHFVYEKDGAPAKEGVSAASYIEDVNEDSVLLFDGLTKNFRYPGWRVGWVVGPKSMIECMITSGSSLDGGPSKVIQRAAMEILQEGRCEQELNAMRQCFAKKRNLMLQGLKDLGIRVAAPSESTFYVWGCLDKLPAPFNNSRVFFEKALEQKVMTVPGAFFDVNPGKERKGVSPFENWMRFSFGPSYETVETGLNRLKKMLKS